MQNYICLATQYKIKIKTRGGSSLHKCEWVKESAALSAQRRGPADGSRCWQSQTGKKISDKGKNLKDK